MNDPRRILRPAAAGSAVLLLPAAAMAAGMPQLDFNTPLTTSQVVWGAIIFVVLYVLLARGGLPLVGSVLEERATRINGDLEQAHAARERAQKGIADAEQSTAQARAESQAAINAALDQAKGEAAARTEQLNARLEQQLRESEAQIAQARASAMQALRQVATDTAATVITRLTGSPPDASRLDQAIGSELASRNLG